MPKSNGGAASAECRGRAGRRGRMRNRNAMLGLVTAGGLAVGTAMAGPASAATVAAPSASGVATAVSSAGTPHFSIFNPPSQVGPAGSSEELTGVYAASPKDVWAVGIPGDPFEHWNGTSWTGQGLPSGPCTASGNQCSVTFIAGTSAHNITAVGGGEFDVGGDKVVSKSVAFHFNGTSWSNMTIPTKVTLGPVLAFSAKNLWSVNGGAAEHFNGSTWTKTELPVISAQPNLDMTSISGSSPSDIWAAGTAFNEGLHRNNSPILEHFNGTAWTNVTIPGGPMTGGLTDVLAITPTDAYFATTLATVQHWNGTTWTMLNTTTQTGAAVTGSALAASSPTDVWLGGLTTLDNFNGTTWTSMPLPPTTQLDPPGQTPARPDAAAAVGAGSVWFVGNTFTSDGNGELPYAMGTAKG